MGLLRGKSFAGAVVGQCCEEGLQFIHVSSQSRAVGRPIGVRINGPPPGELVTALRAAESECDMDFSRRLQNRLQPLGGCATPATTIACCMPPH